MEHGTPDGADGPIAAEPFEYVVAIGVACTQAQTLIYDHVMDSLESEVVAALHENGSGPSARAVQTRCTNPFNDPRR